MKAIYKYKPCRGCKQVETMAKVIKFSNENDAQIRFGFDFCCRNYVKLSRLFPYPDPDADGRQWLFLGYMIMEENKGLFSIRKGKGKIESFSYDLKRAKDFILELIKIQVEAKEC